MTKFLFVRHGEPEYASVGDWNNVPMGIHFSGLSESGRKQIKNTCCELAKYKVDIIVSSPYTRTLQSAAIMAKELNADVVISGHAMMMQAVFDINEPIAYGQVLELIL